MSPLFAALTSDVSIVGLIVVAVTLLLRSAVRSLTRMNPDLVRAFAARLARPRRKGTAALKPEAAEKLLKALNKPEERPPD
ncbi:hypothetical protein ACFQ1S_11355 [Kibdelosporangium lantanae]|uniref:Uncharacterized protein n=1 Tax=Kibdelosporangium lantanae TaxID=1497396 RepID=A0ABW3M874_9PSEU